MHALSEPIARIDDDQHSTHVTAARPTPCFFHPQQLNFKPKYEWAFGEKIEHPETTARAEGILTALEADGAFFEVRRPELISDETIHAVHDPRLVRMLQTAQSLRKTDTFYPAVFMRGTDITPDPGRIAHAGSFCFDSGTPLSRDTWTAARWSASCAVTAATVVASGESRLAYALSRPPGHHATQGLFGGYCYLANSSLAAQSLRTGGAKRVAVLDIDVHHGNGTQQIFWDDPSVLTVSLHGDPNNFFPFFTGFAEEVGGGPARGANLNLPLEEGTDGQAYARALETALARIAEFDPAFLILAAGVDTYERDPMGNMTLTTADLGRIGERVGALGLPTIAVQEGGYYTPHIGRNVQALLQGLREGARGTAAD